MVGGVKEGREFEREKEEEGACTWRRDRRTGKRTMTENESKGREEGEISSAKCVCVNE